VKRMNDAVDYHAEYVADVEAGRRDKMGRKTEAWHEREREEEERRRRRRHKHRRHRGDGEERGERGGAEMSGGLGGGEGVPEGARGGEAVAPGGENPFADPNPGGEERDGHRRHRSGHGHGHHHGRHGSRDRGGESRGHGHHERHGSRDRGGEGHGHRRRPRDNNNNNDDGVEILEPGNGPLGRALPLEPPGQGPRNQGPQRTQGPPRTQGPQRQRTKWVDKRTGRSVSPPKVEMRPWLKKLLGKPPAKQGTGGMPKGLIDPQYGGGDPRYGGGDPGYGGGDPRYGGGDPRQGPRGRSSPPGHPYIDDG